MAIRSAVLLLAVVNSVAAAQSLSPPPNPVAALPGFGRPIDIPATRRRRTELAQRVGRGLIVIPASVQRDLETNVLQDNDFRQNDYFFYLTGLEAPDAWLIIAAGPAKPTVHLLLPQRNPAGEQWTGRKLGPGEEAVSLTGISEVSDVDRLDDVLQGMLAATGGPLHTVLDAEIGRNERIQQWIAEGTALGDVRAVLDSMRMVKDEDELGRLRRAIEITALGHRAAMRAAQSGMFEYEIEAVVEYEFRAHGADRVGFPSIIGSGPNSTTLHYDVNRRRTEPGDLIVIDVGAEYGQYSADVTRTIPVGGRFGPRQRALYDLVLGAQQAAIDAVRPGVTLGTLNAIARQYMRTHSGDLCGPASCDRFFAHGLSHWLGMRVHDVGDYRRPLEAGMVFTIEPGIYLPGEALGIRIEDDILVTETGSVILSAEAPRAAEEIEALMADDPPIP